MLKNYVTILANVTVTCVFTFIQWVYSIGTGSSCASVVQSFRHLNLNV